VADRLDFTCEEIEVLIDMLDEEHQRWYTAGWLAALEEAGKLTDDQRQRIMGLLGIDTGLLGVVELGDLVNLHHEIMRLGYPRPPQDPRPIQQLPNGDFLVPGVDPEPLWACRGYLFDTQEAAKDYKSFSDWMVRRLEREEEDGLEDE
jgi:hypothetical protein